MLVSQLRVESKRELKHSGERDRKLVPVSGGHFRLCEHACPAASLALGFVTAC